MRALRRAGGLAAAVATFICILASITAGITAEADKPRFVRSHRGAQVYVEPIARSGDVIVIRETYNSHGEGSVNANYVIDCEGRTLRYIDELFRCEPDCRTILWDNFYDGVYRGAHEYFCKHYQEPEIATREETAPPTPDPAKEKQVWQEQMQPTVKGHPSGEFSDCDSGCPTMVVVPAGRFMMGSPDQGEEHKDETPQHEVTIARPFAVSKFEITFDEWEKCVAAGACPEMVDAGFGRGSRPVIFVNWHHAQQYVAWLSRVTGKHYRLLSEAEWEYAARAGSTTRYSWGDDIGNGNANCNGCGSTWDRTMTAPVGSFKPNAFGLHDMHGNVMEWVADCWNDEYRNAPADGSAVTQKSPTDNDPRNDEAAQDDAAGDNDHCRAYVYRGGSWLHVPEHLRSASRFGGGRTAWDGLRSETVGLRVARTLDP